MKENSTGLVVLWVKEREREREREGGEDTVLEEILHKMLEYFKGLYEKDPNVDDKLTLYNEHNDESYAVIVSQTNPDFELRPAEGIARHRYHRAAKKAVSILEHWNILEESGIKGDLFIIYNVDLDEVMVVIEKLKEAESTEKKIGFGSK